MDRETPPEKRGVSRSDGVIHNKMQQAHMGKYDELMNYLQRHDKSMAAMLQAYNDELFELPALETESVFVDGFRMGALLMIEIMTSL